MIGEGFTRCIEIELSRGPRAFEDRESLWHHDFVRIARLLEKHLAKLQGLQGRGFPSVNEANVNRLPNLSIAIFGPSGSGKSSFLRTLAAWVNEEMFVKRTLGRRPVSTAAEKDAHQSLQERIRALPVFDPTTWSRNDHFLYAFLAAALEEVRQKRAENEKDCDPEPMVLSPIEREFQEACDYLRVIGDHDTSQEYDPLGFSLDRLHRHTSHLRLRKHIVSMITHLAEELICTPSLILLPVDDIDLAPQHLLTTLCSYHSYLVHPYLVPIFTFTDRMAEDLLARYFRKNITLDGQDAARRIDIEGNRLNLSEQLAVQYLARCFPVRNRIRLGPAPARLQAANFTSGPCQPAEQARGTEVLPLLITASFLLFGHPDRDSRHNVRDALRPATLRRQFQVIDAMLDSDVDRFIAGQFADMAKDKRARPPEQGSGSKSGSTKTAEAASGETPPQPAGPLPKAWSMAFTRASWSLLNIHRDVLGELSLNLEDLYSWTPLRLRSYLLDTILAQDLETRRALLKRWRYRADDRRSQIISLLAANIFRPWLRGEPALGDEQIPIIIKRLEQEGRAEDPGSLCLPATSGLVWFLNLLIGFYLPQILARNRPNDIALKDSIKGRITGVGWDLRNGPVNAVCAADTNQNVGSHGMMFLDVKQYAKCLSTRDNDKEKEEDEARICLFLRIWSSHGYSCGRYWAAISFWRGLSLVGQLLALYDSWQNSLDIPDDKRQEEDVREKEIQAREARAREVRGVINTHIYHGIVPGPKLGMMRSFGLPSKKDHSDLFREGEKGLGYAFEAWDPEKNKSELKCLTKLTEDTMTWLENISDNKQLHIFPMPTGGKGADQAAPQWIPWRDCFIRRLHGEYILGGFLPHLDAAYLEEQKDYYREQKEDQPENNGKQQGKDDKQQGNDGEQLKSKEYRWTAGIALNSWMRSFLSYWDDHGRSAPSSASTKPEHPNCQQVLQILRSSPIIKPLTDVDPEDIKGHPVAGIFHTIPRVLLDDFVTDIPGTDR